MPIVLVDSDSLAIAHSTYLIILEVRQNFLKPFLDAVKGSMQCISRFNKLEDFQALQA